MNKLTTFYEVPRLDEMVLLQEIATPCEFSHSKTERSRTTSINEQLDRYNRWLPFAQSSVPGKDVRSAALDLQQSIHEMNSFVAKMMIKFDKKIVEL